jgi:diketogulonate reductase-like aldo/keto reductase
MPMLGFGVWKIDDPQWCEQCVVDALAAGYRLIDTAAIYGNEEAVGRGIARSEVPREEIFVATKLWLQDAGYDSTLRAFDVSLKKLGLDYLDLYLIHQPYRDVWGSWSAMQKLYADGRTRAIGLSNFYPDRVEDLLLNFEVPPAVDQLELHPYFQRPDVLAYLNSNKIALQAWGPLGQGRVGMLKDDRLAGIALKYHRTTAQIVLRWHYQRGVLSIPKSSNPQRIIQNYNIWDFSLSDSDMAKIAALDRGEGKTDHRAPETVRRLNGMTLG